MTSTPTPPTIIVTGAAGFIGSAVSRALLDRGMQVVGIDNFDPYYPRVAKERNVKSCAAVSGRWRFVEADITDEAALREIFLACGPEGVIHLAAKAGVRPSIVDPVGYARANVLGTQAVLSAALAARRAGAGCRRVVLASSSSVYGNASRVPFSEEDTATAPISPYAATKRACELLAHTHHHLTGMPVASLRFFTVYGPGQRPDLAISLFMRKIAAGEPITMFGDGSMSRDYTFIDDIVTGVLAAYDRIDGHGCRVWNLGNSAPVSLRDMIATIGRVVGREPVIRTAPMQPGDVDRTYADLTRSRAELDYNPSIGFEEGVARQWAWLREQV